jgi:RNA polymerase sigma-70 factor (ECF subfamily)
VLADEDVRVAGNVTSPVNVTMGVDGSFLVLMNDQRRRGGLDDDELAALWRSCRGRLSDIAYRMLGSVREAEDVVGEAFTRLVARGVTGIDDPQGWLVTVTCRLCVDRLRSHELRRRAYVGPWLPEPIVDLHGARVDPADRITLDDTVRMALLVVLERMSPAERTAFVLHDVFGVPFDDIASMVGRSPEACRQLASRARRRVDEDAGARFHVDVAEHARVAARFKLACESGDLDQLIEVLAPDVTGDFDSGGAIPGAPLEPLTGARPVAEQLRSAFSNVPCTFAVVDVNGLPGVTVSLGAHLMAVISIGVQEERVALIHAIGNPQKLPAPA